MATLPIRPVTPPEPSRFKLAGGIALSACASLVAAAFGAMLTSLVF